MPTGLTADIYNNKDTSLRHFALRCATQFGGFYQACDYGEGDLPLDKAPVLEPSPWKKDWLKRAEEKLKYWEELKNNPEKARLERDRTLVENAINDYELSKKIKETEARYNDMKKRVENWDVPEEYSSIKTFMLDQLHDSIKHDIIEVPEKKALPPVEEWVERGLQIARESVEQQKESVKKEEEIIKAANEYIRKFYEELDKVEPFEGDE